MRRPTLEQLTVVIQRALQDRFHLDNPLTQDGLAASRQRIQSS